MDEVATVRSFNRFYTGVIGVLGDGLLKTPYSLTEARVIFELAQRQDTEVLALRRTLGLDPGYLSRMLARFESDALVERERSPDDARRQIVRLTGRGREVFATLDERSATEIRDLLAGLPGEARTRLLASMRTIQDVLGDRPAPHPEPRGERSAAGSELRGERSAAGSELRGERSAAGSELRGDRSAAGSELRGDRSAPGPELRDERSAAGPELCEDRPGAGSELRGERSAAGLELRGERSAARPELRGERSVAGLELCEDRPGGGLELRGLRPGDLGWVVQRNGVLYDRECGWDRTYEALVARVAADYAANHDPSREDAWIAERNGEPVGCVFCVRKTDRTAQLRLLHVEPEARGLGIGAALIDACLAFAEKAGYEDVVLWTTALQKPAHRLYERAGFRLETEEDPVHRFGDEINGQIWRKAF
ncbi:GNAT family N-acetyltransferase [Spirillospora sp. CA-294931]|uniref:bifunctional helix-turn-helix transcriptional regulator/GNAT family N-acetyltransferase n=1 Tax=Spirillospora sp. CA-294931 TaxID=3240042 RepID=UPI003D8B55EE